MKNTGKKTKNKKQLYELADSSVHRAYYYYYYFQSVSAPKMVSDILVWQKATDREIIHNGSTMAF